MISGFEEETGDLNEEELKLVPMFVDGLSSKIGEENAIKNAVIRKKLEVKGIDVSDARIRKIINYIRLRKMVRNVIAGKKGYWVETDQAKIEEYKQSLIQRSNAILAIWKTF